MDFYYPIGSTERAILEAAMERKLTDREIQEWGWRQMDKELNRLAENQGNRRRTSK